MKYKAAFVVNARNKAKWVRKAIEGAIRQTYPCHIILSDQSSDDYTYDAMETYPYAKESEHKVDAVRCPVPGKYGMRAANEHFLWCCTQTDAEWIFQCSADDYSMPNRVKACMEAVEKYPCSAVATHMWFTEPGGEVNEQTPKSGFPFNSGYVPLSDGISKLAYGSCIAGYHRSFLEKAGSPEDSTMDVFYGALASLDKGFYVVAEPHHVHVNHVDFDNMGFQGKMRAAEATGDEETMTRINELNRFQLLDLYCHTMLRAQSLFPLMHQNDRNAMVQMILNQAVGWRDERKKLHAKGWTPGVL